MRVRELTRWEKAERLEMRGKKKMKKKKQEAVGRTFTPDSTQGKDG
jgi:hypothetical protein